MTSYPVLIAVGIVVSLVLVYFIVKKPWVFLGGLLRNLFVGGSVLLLVDYLGRTAGLHIPVNAGTLGVTAVLGWPGVVAMAAIHQWVM